MKKKTLARILCKEILNWKTGERQIKIRYQNHKQEKSLGVLVEAICQSKAAVENLRNEELVN